jgi:hypothetical protein
MSHDSIPLYIWILNVGMQSNTLSLKFVFFSSFSDTSCLLEHSLMIMCNFFCCFGVIRNRLEPLKQTAPFLSFAKMTETKSKQIQFV